MAKPEPRYEGFLPGLHTITAYGDGGFRFAEMSHRGSLLLLPSGILAIDVQKIADLTLEQLAKVIDERDAIELLLIGTGSSLQHLPVSLRLGLANAGIRYEVMQTGAAVRTYNVLLAEDRHVAAVLIAV